MSIIITANLTKATLNKINEYIPPSRRSKLLSDYILHDMYKLPNDKEGVESIIEWPEGEEMVIQPIFFSEASAHKIDGLLSDLNSLVSRYQFKGVNLGRSMLIRAITKDFAEYVKQNPIEDPETQFLVVQMPKGTKDRLSKHIDKMERSSTLNQFIMNDYKPNKSAKELKRRLPDDREILSLILDVDTTLKYVNEIADDYGFNVKKTHIIRDAIFQLIDCLEAEQPKKHSLESKLSRTLEELAKHADPDEIRELLEKYQNEV